LRAHLVLRSDRGFSVQEIAAIHACGQDVGRTWRPRDERAGVTGLEDDPRSGRPPKDRLTGPIIEAQASPSPPWSGQVQAGVRVARLSAYRSQRWRLLLWCTSVRRSRHQMGWRWAGPRLAPARNPDPEAQAKRAALEEATQQAREGLAHLL
jgi:transposase